jgi:hypothetical protein
LVVGVGRGYDRTFLLPGTPFVVKGVPPLPDVRPGTAPPSLFWAGYQLYGDPGPVRF